MSTMRAELTVRKTSWHYRLYRWWIREVDATERRLDLCRYMRCLLVWLPLTLLVFGVLRVAYIVSAPVWWPLTRRRARVTMARVGKGVEAISEKPKVKKAARGVGVLLGILYVGAILTLIVSGIVSAFESSTVTGLIVISSILGGIDLLALIILLALNFEFTFLRLLWRWSVAKKQRVCPLIEVR